ncbi:MAG: hypothetical protein QOF30_892 [Acidimicrobiaceae bacterium]|jgi:hypothetical protein|nr:hypothetical protein [Acidimicrobiaceae bacterium]
MPDPSDADAASATSARDLDDPSAELRLVVEDLANLRAEAEELRRGIGDPGEAPGDQAARANLITSLEMTEAVIETLVARATTLRQRLGGQPEQ